MSDLPPFLLPSGELTFGTGTYDPAGRRVDSRRGVEWVKKGWELFKRNPGIWIAIVIIMAAIMIVLAIIPIIGPLALNVLMPILLGGIALGCQSLANNTRFGIDALFEGFKQKQSTGNLALVGVIYTAGWFIIGIFMFVVLLVVGGVGLIGAGSGAGAGASGNMVALLAGGGMLMILLVMLIGMALMLPLAMAMYFAPQLVMLREVAPFAAMKASFFACLKNFVPFLVYGLVLFVPFLILFLIAMVMPVIGVILYFITMLVLAPVILGANYAAYTDIFE